MSSERTLDELAIQYGTDKSSKVHAYTRFYELYFGSWRERPVRLLEIGVGSGGSLRMWQDYFPRGQIFGLDCRDRSEMSAGRIKVFHGSQADSAMLERLGTEVGPFDIVIDDGSHRWSEQIESFERLYPHLAPSGVYAVEDLHTSWWSDFQSGPTRTIAYLGSLVEEINLHGQSGYGHVCNDPEFAARLPTLNEFQRSIQSITFTKSLAVIQKRPFGPAG